MAGASSSGLRAALPVPAVELSGCGRSQNDVAILMARLRNIQGVTRVSLARSDKDRQAGAGAGASSTNGGGIGNVDGFCGKSAPSFDLVVFFENDAAATAARDAAAPGAAAAAAAAAPAATPAPTAQNTSGGTK